MEIASGAVRRQLYSSSTQELAREARLSGILRIPAMVAGQGVDRVAWMSDDTTLQ